MARLVLKTKASFKQKDNHMEATKNRDQLIDGVTEAAHDVKRVATDMTASAKGGVVDTIERIGRVYGTLRNFGLDDALSHIGLQKRGKSSFGGIVGFGVGFFAGAATAMLVTPQSGRVTRRMIQRKARALFGATAPAAERVADQDAAEPVVVMVDPTPGASNNRQGRDKKDNGVDEPKPPVGLAR